MSPATTMRIESTDAKIGRSMKKEEIFMTARASRARRHRWHALTHGYPFWRDHGSGPHPLQAVDDHDFTAFETLAYDPQTLQRAPELLRAILDLVSGPEHQHVV